MQEQPLKLDATFRPYRCNLCMEETVVTATEAYDAQHVLIVSLDRGRVHPGAEGEYLGRSKIFTAIRPPVEIEVAVNKPKYDLKAIIVHCGSHVSHGHYVTFTYDACRKMWTLLNDDHAIYEMSELPTMAIKKS